MSQEELRKVILEYMESNPCTIAELAKGIGICRVTLNCFLKGSVVIPRTWRLIDKYVADIIFKESTIK